MKTIKIMKRLMGCAAAILALTACSESEDLLAAYHSDSKAVHITAQVGKASADGFTRSNPLGTAEEQAKFNVDDEISVQADGQDAVTYKYDGKEWQPQGGKFLKWEKETMNFTAYYPATFNGNITQPTEYTSPESLAAADFMSFTGNVTNSGNNSLTLTMERKMANGKMLWQTQKFLLVATRATFACVVRTLMELRMVKLLFQPSNSLKLM